MRFDKSFLDELTMRAKNNPRLRQHFDLRTSGADTSQRMLNAMEPGTQVPIHRHPHSSETVIVLRGSVMEYFYDEAGNVTDSFKAGPATGCAGFSVPPCVWHSTESLESGTVIFEAKDGAFEPLCPEDIKEVK